MMLSGHAIPVHVNAPSVYSPLHADDIAAMVPRLLAVASVPAVTINWGGSEAVSIEEWCAFLAELTGSEAGALSLGRVCRRRAVQRQPLRVFLGGEAPDVSPT
jgi:hypothetical protein